MHEMRTMPSRCTALPIFRSLLAVITCKPLVMMLLNVLLLVAIVAINFRKSAIALSRSMQVTRLQVHRDLAQPIPRTPPTFLGKQGLAIRSKDLVTTSLLLLPALTVDAEPRMPVLSC